MGNFFKKFFKDVSFEDNGETAVCCPFPHYSADGTPYKETNPSAHINLDNGVFHCKVCGEGMSEAAFMSKITGASYTDAKRLLGEINNANHTFMTPHMTLLGNPIKMGEVHKLGISQDVAKELKLGYTGVGFDFPVIIYGEVLDIRNYNPGGKPKVKSQKGAPSGLIIPFDTWIDDKSPTLICAGEKDMAVARSNGFNAITITGGEMALPKFFKNTFKGKEVYIAYDNDDAGKQGMLKLGAFLYEAGAIVKLVYGFHEVCKEKGEDITDFFMKYGREESHLTYYMSKATEFTDEMLEVQKEKDYPTVTLTQSLSPKYKGRYVRAKVLVNSTYEVTFNPPEMMTFTKGDISASPYKNSMTKGQQKTWALEPKNAQDILKLVDSGLRPEAVRNNALELAYIPKGEDNISKREESSVTVYKASVQDFIESDAEDPGTRTELDVYSIGKQLSSGKSYIVTFKVVPHPYNSQANTMIAIKAEDADETLNAFKVTPEVIEHLKVFQVGEGQNVEQKMTEITEKAKGIINYDGNELIIQSVDLFYHTPLHFNFGRHKDIRCYLDGMIVGESRTGKSDTATKLMNVYRLGTFASLKTATVAGLIGGSNKVRGSFKTMVGLIPRNHMKAVILEEFSGAHPEFIKSMTDIRSSNEVRISRVNGTLRLPAMVRMLTLSNQKTINGKTKPLASYPNGVEVLLELIGAAEDIARYDFVTLIGEPDSYGSPLWIPDDPFNDVEYQARVRWAWTRTADQIIFEPGVDAYIVEMSELLNKAFNSHIKIFGTEAWKKLARVAIATAANVVSTDPDFEKIIVTKEHVDWAYNFFFRIYDNSLFRLREYAAGVKERNTITTEIVKALQDIFNHRTTLIDKLYNSNGINRTTLEAASGLNREDFNATITELDKFGFIDWHNDRLLPSVRFRKAMAKIDRNTHLKKAGEVDLAK